MVGTKLYDLKGTLIYPETSASSVLVNGIDNINDAQAGFSDLYKKFASITGSSEAQSSINIDIKYCLRKDSTTTDIINWSWGRNYLSPTEKQPFAWKQTVISYTGGEPKYSHELVAEYIKPLEAEIHYNVYYTGSLLTSQQQPVYNEDSGEVTSKEGDATITWTKTPANVTETTPCMYIAQVSKTVNGWSVTSPALVGTWSYPSILVTKYKIILNDSSTPSISYDNYGQPDGWGDLIYDNFNIGTNYIWAINATKNNNVYIEHENRYWSAPSLIGITIIGSGDNSGDDSENTDSGGTGTTDPIEPEITEVKEYITVWGAEITDSTSINSNDCSKPFNVSGVQYGDFHPDQSSAEADATELRELLGNTSTIYIIEITRYKDLDDAYVPQNGSCWGDFSIVKTNEYDIPENTETVETYYGVFTNTPNIDRTVKDVPENWVEDLNALDLLIKEYTEIDKINCYTYKISRVFSSNTLDYVQSSDGNYWTNPELVSSHEALLENVYTADKTYYGMSIELDELTEDAINCSSEDDPILDTYATYVPQWWEDKQSAESDALKQAQYLDPEIIIRIYSIDKHLDQNGNPIKVKDCYWSNLGYEIYNRS